MSQNLPAILVLADGTVFRGRSIGASGQASAGQTVGEVVFNTAMTGYQEILTDPSYTKQIVTLTYPHIGNYGVNLEDVESGQVYAAGLIIRDLPLIHSNFRNSQSLSEYLVANKVVAIADIDTRKLTRILREKGAQTGAIIAGEADEAKAIAAAMSLIQGFPGLTGMDLAKVVTCNKPYEFTEAEWALGQGFAQPPAKSLCHSVNGRECPHSFVMLPQMLEPLLQLTCQSFWQRYTPAAAPLGEH